MVDVFISYSRRDQETVAKLARAIEAEGYDVWWDAELPPHQSYGDVITAKIAMAKAALVVWSDEAVKSEWVRAEADMARNQRKLIQTALNNVMPPLPFNQIQYAEMGDWNGEPDHSGWRKVKLSLAELCGQGDPEAVEKPEPDRPAPPPQPLRSEPPLPYRPQPAQSPSKWPLFAGIGIAAVALVAAGGILLGQRNNAPAAAPASAGPAPAALAEASPVPASGGDAAPPSTDDEIADGDGAEAPPPPDPADMTIPDSSTRLIAPSEIAMMGPSTLKIARGEIFARKGRRFRDPWLRDWFSRYAWYRPRFDEVRLNPVEQRNVALLRRAEARYGQ